MKHNKLLALFTFLLITFLVVKGAYVRNASNRVYGMVSPLPDKQTNETVVEVLELSIPTPTPVPTLDQQIESFGSDLFKNDWPLFKKIILCESSFRTDAVSSTNDTGLAQISWVHGISQRWLKNWKINLLVAYDLFSEQGVNPWRSSFWCWSR